MKVKLQKLKPIQYELILILIFFLVIQFIIGSAKETIKADAIGYYDYLPSVFIHHDINRRKISESDKVEIYDRIKNINVYVNYNGYLINKYPCGTAILQLPFFTAAKIFTNLDGTFKDGYQKTFHRAIFFAAIFYLFLSLVFLKNLLCFYKINNNITSFIQILLVFATSVTNYANFDAGFSHIYSLFAITAFLYFTKYYFNNQSLRNFLWASFFLGLVILIRQINVLIIFFIPFLANSPQKLWQIILETFKRPIQWISGALIIVLLFFIQSLFWFLQTGEFFIYSYQGEGFNFLDPQIINILFSYKKGLFVYTPIVFLATLSSFGMLIKKQFYLFFTWFGFFFLLTYILSSWWCWHYGGSYGLRAYIDFYPIFFIPLAILINEINSTRFKLIIVGLSLFSIPVNIIQTIQYKRFILHMDDMDKEKYWKVFLNTKPMYRGILWKRNYDYNQYKKNKEIHFGDVTIEKKSEKLIWKINTNSIENFNQVNLIQVKFENNFNRNDNTKIILSLHDESNNRVTYWHNPYLLHFSEGKLNNYHTGLYNFEIDSISKINAQSLRMTVVTGKHNNILKNLRITFFSEI